MRASVRLLRAAMRDRVGFLLIALCLLGSGCMLLEILAKLAGWPKTGDVMAAIGGVAVWSFAVGVVVQRATRAAVTAEANRRAQTVAEGWLPDVVAIDISQDLVPEMRHAQQAILDEVAAIRGRHGIETPIVHIRDNSVLATRSYAISINGIHIFGSRLGVSDELRSHLLAALEDVWGRNADAIRYFADLRAQAA